MRGFVTDIEEERIPKGLSEDVVRLISTKKKEPEFMLEWRLKAYRYWASLDKRACRAEVGQLCEVSADRLSGDHLLLGAEAEAGPE